MKLNDQQREFLNDPITTSESVEIIKKQKNRKAPELYGLPAELQNF